MSGGLNWGLILVVFILPLALGVAALGCARGLRRRWLRLTVRVFGSVLLLAFLAVVAAVVPYEWALHLEAKWTAAKPKTKAELEACLSFYSERQIQVAQSLWGRHYQLQPGERMVQYRLLYVEPLDIVYTRSNTIVAVYTSYE